MRRACDALTLPAAAACVLLLACLHLGAAVELAPGVCSSMDIRNSPDHIEKLKGCRVIEGQLSIVLMERVNKRTFENVSFPELREVTEYIKIYRVKGVRNLGDLFPNLTVVRGMRLYKDYAIVIYDNEHLESLGLRSLTRIQRGAVRIQNNDRLCYADTIDWSQIISKDIDKVIIRSNYDPRLCGLCPEAQSRLAEQPHSANQCPFDSSRTLLCWDDKHCQKICPSECGESGCMNNNTCCHRTCLGGCSGVTSRDCFTCKHYSLGYGPNRTCVEQCPAHTYKLFARCVSEEDCRKMPPPPPAASGSGNDAAMLRPASNIKAYKIHNDTCTYICPNGYMESGDESNANCVPCPDSVCMLNCTGGKIDSIATAEQFRGCTIVRGKLEIALRASGGNTMAALESSLGEIREIVGCLQVTRSNMLISLMFLKNLKRIDGTAKPEACKEYVLNIFNNPNLELLWDFKNYGNINISGGSLYIHLNPKLCYDRIVPLQNMTRDPPADFDERFVSEQTNGNQALSCSKDELHLKVHQQNGVRVILTWNAYCVGDSRRLLGYSVYYIPAEQNVTLYGQRDACYDTWNVIDKTKDEVRQQINETTEVRKKGKDYLKNPCEEHQPSFTILPDLKPFTRYAAYVKAYTTQTEKKGAQSSIIYFKTLPGRPTPPINLVVEHSSPHSVNIKWSAPMMPNGIIVRYHVEIQANSYNKPKILGSNSNYCASPNALSNKIQAGHQLPEVQKDKMTGDVMKNGTCSCKEDDKPNIKFNSIAEEERKESINFENELQNEVYVRTSKKPKSGKTRRRRSVDTTLQSMLVILSDAKNPTIDDKYFNTSDGEGYVQSSYYELSSNTTMLKVTNMRHCTWYTVNVWACRAQDPNEKLEDFKRTWCSDRAYNTFRTLDLDDADAVSNLQADILPSNKTLPEVNVTWEPPKNPNGFLAAYKVVYTRVEDGAQGSQLGLDTCVTADDYEENQHYILRNLIAGNYSLQVTPVTVRGLGIPSKIYVFIPERTGGPGNEWIWGLVGGCLLMLAVVAGGTWYARRGLLPSAEGNKLFASVNPEYVSTVYVPDEWEVPRGNIEFVRELGQGSFGMVYEGLAKNIVKGKPETRCAVKTVNEHATDRERIEFLNEASVMKAFDTFHVVRLLGVVSRGQPTLVVMELMELGDLKTYLRSHRPDAESSLPKKDSGNPPTLQNILQMAIEIADGMAYLSAKKFVHRDLAARNCMVAGDLTVKVGDFGMTRDIYETDYYRKGTKGLLPVRWMSPESLKDGVFSSNSDVWSYGVVLWEMVTLAMLPYQGLSNEQVVRYVVEGGVMERPEHCPDRLYELMRACWAHRPMARPAFLHLVADLAPAAQPYFRHRSFFHSPQGQEMYALQRSAMEEEQEMPEVSVGAVGSGSGSNLFGVSGRLASWVLSSLRSRTSDDAAAEPLQPLQPLPALKAGPNGVLQAPASGC